MSIEPTLASIPNMTVDQRKVLRTNAQAKLASGDPKWAIDSPKVLAALEAFEGEQGRAADQKRTTKIARLEDASSVERIILAFELEPPTLNEANLIQTLLDHPGSTCAEMSAHHAYQENAWDMQYGLMCAKRQEFLWPLQPGVRDGIEPNTDLLTVKTRGQDGVLRYTNKPEALEGFRQLGFRVKAP
jgi:hypothetical protein